MKKPLTNISQHTLFLLFFTLAFFHVFYPFHYEEGLISADAVFDAQIARNILLGDGLGWQATLQPPFHAILTAAIYPLTENILIGGILISKIMWWLLPLPVYILAKEMFGIRVGLVSAILVFFHPHFGFASGMMEPTTTYPALLMFGICFVWLAFTRVNNIFYALLGGLFFAFAFLSRGEGLLIFLFALAALSFIVIRDHLDKRNNSKRLLILLILLISFILSSLPYLLFLKGTYGKFVLSPKSTYVQIWMKWRIYHDNDLGEQGNPELWGLSKNGKLMWQEPKGLGDLVEYLMSHPEKSWQVYVNNFKMQIPGKIPNNSGQWLYPQVYPWYFAIPALFWITVSLLRRTEWDKTIFLLSPFAILFMLPIFTGGWWKYLLPYAPFLIILAVAGLSSLSERFNWRYLLPAYATVIVIYSLWTVKASPLVKHGNREVMSRISMAEEQKAAGEWAKKRFNVTPNYMIQWSKLAYYLDGRWTAMPVTDYYRMIWYARKNRVDYLVFETSGRDESEEIVRSMGNTPDIEVADAYESPTASYGVVFLRLKR